ncbi:alpha/beta hydrolase [Corynebacterium nasicanis]|uniref:Alpha/beta hydrolase n=1 Tax=Corynebacterium nasicanis TaxID=1448267 RepID=A0ABW1QAW4_9CORY
MNRRPLLALTTAAALTLPLAPAALAMDGMDGSAREAAFSSFEDPASSGSSLDAALSSLSLVGSSEWELPAVWRDVDSRYPLPTDDSITQVKLIDVAVESERRERWTVASPAMKRNVEVQIWRAADRSVPAPMLYMLDGIDAPLPSGWFAPGTVPAVFAEENVTLVMPTQAIASNYSDWVNEDPALGRHMWETFIAEELAPLLENPAHGLNFNGKRGIGGLSMGANGAVHLANARPDLFDGVFGISGCYSPMSRVGRQMASFVVTSRGGTLENMWGPYGSPEWRRHDTTLHPEGLRHQAVYLSTGNGNASPAERAFYADHDADTAAVGALLERGVLDCTRELDDSLTKAGINHHKVHYKNSGSHNWVQFNEELQPAWEHIRPALDVIPAAS